MDRVSPHPTSARRRSAAGAVSVRARITLAITLAAALGMFVVGAVVYTVERNRIAEAVHDRLIAQLDAAKGIVADPPEGGWVDARDAVSGILQLLVPGETSGALGLIDGDVALVSGVGMRVDLEDDPGFITHVITETAAGEAVVGTYRGDGHNWAYLASPVAVAADPDTDAVFVAAYDLDLEFGGLDLSAQAYLYTAVGAVAVLGAVAWFVSTRLMRPLRQMGQIADRVSALSLEERLPVRGNDDVSELARTMNGMLDRLDDAMGAQRRLLGDVGHELKTPLTIVHGYLDVMDARDEIDIENTRRLAIDEIERMSRLVADLVDVAAALDEKGLQRAHVPAGQLLRTIAQKAGMIAGTQLVLGPVAEADAELDAARITQAVLQLVQNAVTHGGGEVDLSSRLVGDDLQIVVRDHGAGIPDADKARIFERFQRLQRGGRGTDGSGLGLTIVQLIAEQHGGEITVADAVGGGSRFVLSVPIGVSTDPSGGDY